MGTLTLQAGTFTFHARGWFVSGILYVDVGTSMYQPVTSISYGGHKRP